MKRLLLMLMAAALAVAACSKPAPPAAPAQAPAAPKGPAVTTAAGLTIEEHIIPQGPTDPDFYGLKQREILERRKEWRQPSLEKHAALINVDLQPIGYRLVPRKSGEQTVLDLKKGEQTVYEGLTGLWSFSRSADGSGFFIRGRKDTDAVVLTPSGPLPNEQAFPNMFRPPIYVGNDPAYISFDNASMNIQVYRAEKLIYSCHFPRNMASPSQAALNFTEWDGKWVLETRDARVIVDGQDLNRQLGPTRSSAS